MGGGGSDSNVPVQGQEYNPDQAALKEYVNNQGQAYKGLYDRVNSLDAMKYTSGPSGFTALGHGADNGGAYGVDVTDMLNSFRAWQTDQANAKTAWSNYADLVAKQGGGQGQQTILGSPVETSAIGSPANVAAIPRRGKA